METVIQGFVAQTLKMDPLEKFRRWKRSLDGYITFRKAVLLALCTFAFILYVGPSIFSWLFQSKSNKFYDRLPLCVHDKLKKHAADLSVLNGHSNHKPWRETDLDYLAYIGNGHFGLALDSFSDTQIPEENLTFRIRGQRTLSVAASYKPYVEIVPEFADTRSESGSVVSYIQGLVHRSTCFQSGDDGGLQVSVGSQIYAHRAIPSVLVQEVRLANPTAHEVSFKLNRRGIIKWDSAKSHVQTLSVDGSDQKFIVVSGVVIMPRGVPSTDEPYDSPSSQEDLYYMVTVVVAQLEDTIVVNPRMSHTLNILSAIAYSQPMAMQQALEQQSTTETQAIDAIKQAAGMSIQALHAKHVEVWQALWTTGFGISHSYADNAINGAQINATMYYVLSQAPTPLHSLQASDTTKTELSSHLAYLEGCYGGLPTLHASNLWRTLGTLEDVNTVVRFWILTLEKNGCHQLIRAGADGVIQAMVLSFAGLKFHHQHLELNSHPKDLHRDYQMRRVSYGNSTHLNITVEVLSDNKAVLRVALDRRDKDYFACDAGCLDPPVKLSTEAKTFPVKLTDPVTAVLYITSDHIHMQELKHAIHVKELVIAPAHEHHVIALHKHGNKLGGLPTIFWFSVGSLILIFHLFLFKLIWQEYCAGQDKFRTRKFSDYE